MAAGDTGAPAAGGAGKDGEPESPRGPDPDHHAPVSPGASEEEEGASGAVEAGQDDDAPDPEDEPEEGGDATEDDMDEEEEEGDEDEEDAPTHLPFAPAEEESLEETTTVDPSYTISLIRQLIPNGSSVEKEFSDKQGLPEERSVGRKDQLEECGCILWDLAASEPQAELMINNLVIEVLLENLRTANSSRVKEICLGIMGNLACHESVVAAISLKKGLIATVVEQLFLDDVKCLSETFRLLAAILRSSAFVSWAEALLPDEILSRILRIVGKTDNSTLLEKIIDFLSTVIDNRDVIAMLIQPLLKLGLVDRVIGLLTTELERSPDEKLDRSGSLDLVLHFMEELSVIHCVSKAMTSNDRLIKVLVNMIKSPDKVEVASYCASVVIVISNFLTDGKHLVPMISRDLPFLEGLLEVLPEVPDDDQARYALWSILSRVLAQVQGTELNSLSLDRFASLFSGKFGLIKDDLESQVVDEEKLTPEDALLKGWISRCLMAISFFMERWIEEKSSQGNKDAIDNAREVLSYCQKALR
ncbi:protein saal1-like [Triticum dicoccoides]|uniref:protein saal1-like n=1 Tax=Triticum dicoccoides TaxID=85692 RepID=UPI00188E5786|nr:protein saal1-like [Triticum dicoccoides]